MRIPRLTFPAVLASAAVVLVFTSGTAYAINEWTGANIKNGTLTGADIKTNSVPGTDVKDNTLKSADVLDNSLKSVDILNGTLTGADVADGSLTSLDILNGTLTGADVADGSIAGIDILNESLGFADLAVDSVQASEIADSSIDAGEIVDFGLSNQDVGVLFAQVNADGTLANSSGGVTSEPIGTGTYEVDFAHNVQTCAFVVTQGEAGIGGAGGAITGATDRSGNSEGAFVTTRDAAGALVNTAFQIVAVC